MQEGNIKPGNIVYIKISDEPVFCLSVRPIDGPHVMQGVLSGVIAKVRRPNVDQNGSIMHKIEEFFIEELETEEDAEVRKAGKIEALKAQFKAEREATLGSGKLASSN